MNIAPIQMVELSFRKLSAEVDFEHLPDGSEPRDAHSLLENVGMRTQVRTQKLEKNDPRGTPHFVTLRILIDNERHEEEADQRFSPYLIDVEAGAVVVLAPGIERLGDPEDLVAVNGPALVWGAIREQVMNMTARMPAGPALLPSVNFHDLKKSARAERAGSSSEAKPAEAEKPTKRPRLKKP